MAYTVLSYDFRNSIFDLDVKGKVVLCRSDFNVPMHNGIIVDDFRIRTTLPTIQYLVNRGARVLLLTHFGRPKGYVVESLRVDPIARYLSSMLNMEIEKLDDVCGSLVEDRVARMRDGQILFLENVRFHKEEMQNDLEFARALARLADLFVNDAFGVAHRTCASTVGITRYLPSFYGLLLKQEVDVLSKVLQDPARPFTVIMGGAKVDDKLGLMENLYHRVDNFILGGGLAFTFLKARGCEVGESLLDRDRISWARQYLDKAERKGVKVYLPIDTVVSDSHCRDETQLVDTHAIPSDKQGLDIGPATSALYGDIIATSKLIIWNGPMGVFELPRFSRGTRALAEAIANTKSAYSVVGGGDTLASVSKFKAANQFSHISTGGGALLAFMEGKRLPALEALQGT